MLSSHIKQEIDSISNKSSIIENSEDRIVKLEREIKNMNNKMDKILELLSNHNKPAFQTLA